MKPWLFVVASAVVLLASSAAEAKCQKGARVIDNITRSECSLIRGVWVDSRRWSRPAKRVGRPARP